MERMTANQHLAADATSLTELFRRVQSHARRDGACLISEYASSCKTASGIKKSRTVYPTTSFTMDGVKRKFYAHHVVVMYKRLQDGIREMWDTSSHQVSHDCHNPLCVRVEHLSLTTAEENRDKNTHCIGAVVCTVCAVSMPICKHATRCVTVVTSICSRCEHK